MEAQVDTAPRDTRAAAWTDPSSRRAAVVICWSGLVLVNSRVLAFRQGTGFRSRDSSTESNLARPRTADPMTGPTLKDLGRPSRSLIRECDLAVKSRRPSHRIVYPKSLIRDSASPPRVNAFKRFDNSIVVSRVIACCRDGISRASCRQRDAAGCLRVRRFQSARSRAAVDTIAARTGYPTRHHPTP